MSHLLAFILGLFASYFMFSSPTRVQTNTDLKCPDLKIDYKPDKEISDAFKSCNEKNEKLVLKLFEEQASCFSARVRLEECCPDRWR